MKKEYLNKKTGESIESKDLISFIDFDKVGEYKKSFGYYQIVTSELTMDAQTVIDKYHGLTQIEDQFRVMKSSLETRPLFVRTPEHIDAHLLVCMIALIIIRIIQKKIRDMDGNKRTDVNWNVGMSSERIQNALNKWKLDKLPGDLYRFMDIDDPDLAKILDAFGIVVKPKLYHLQELKSIKTGTKIFM